jgi:hypothetical protein
MFHVESTAMIDKSTGVFISKKSCDTLIINLVVEILLFMANADPQQKKIHNKIKMSGDFFLNRCMIFCKKINTNL